MLTLLQWNSDDIGHVVVFKMINSNAFAKT